MQSAENQPLLYLSAFPVLFLFLRDAYEYEDCKWNGQRIGINGIPPAENNNAGQEYYEQQTEQANTD